MENLLRDAKQVLTLEEAALFMGISKSSLYKMTHKHELPFFRPNGKIIYFEKSELLNWMRQNLQYVRGWDQGCSDQAHEWTL